MLRLLDGIVDVYLPDFKYADTGAGSLYSKVPDYPARARAALVEMFRQKGSRLEIDDDGLLQSGLLVRVLVLPNGAAGVAESLAWIAETLSPKVAISLMAQYYPIHRAAGEREVRGPQSLDHDRGVGARPSPRSRRTASSTVTSRSSTTANRYYRPDFRDRETPFRDIRDFQ